MSDAFQDIDVSQISAEEFSGLVGQLDDDQLREILRGVGAKKVLDGIFGRMRDHFRPDRAGDLDTTIGFTISDEGAEYDYAVRIANGTCTIDEAKPADPRVALGTDLVTFAKLVTGHADGPQLFMRRQLKVSGDLMFATRVMTFFDRPKA
ncbi:MAG TPA: SCP2 sterol-binding domain-containing protein [Actinomycetota bacterium]|nr:SCP2 sterol-binding domain-containing protein [Actinomycetota bacterium]